MERHSPLFSLSLWLILSLLLNAPRAYASGPQIVGSERFVRQAHQALDLLKSKDRDAYAIVSQYVGRIQEGEHSGMWAYRTPPTFEASDKTAFYSVTWFAATIAHDSFHSKLFHEYRKAHGEGAAVPEDIWTGTAAEQKCMKHQIAVMKRIGAPRKEIDYARKQAGGGYVKDKETWKDYKNRNW